MNPTPDPTSTGVPSQYILGVPWDGDALAALLAGGLALATLIWTIVAFFLTRGRLSGFEERTLEQQHEATIRERHRLELNDGIGYLLSKSKQSQIIGLTMLESLRNAEWATDDDRLKVVAVLNVVAED